ncbi:hypothetical protein DICPUDRAFT_91770 [Dictyostelium purpureum]|uniref:Oxidoreductase n=1 Tax=Dictyostelium purpureum TaxID=5786 RepID=F0ZGZ4_DICPU|nr:uncharacterized protein DICPUDRAFT_91770 [Dictyostelium purpureum]EGC36800.1 hypothetical protein DICPUDRAFT_91770 [Dictyostelium purpureum]|eukprot:XP_003286671.1 hypothetical protein DICPUDRAFT_91770 [Dictyostelium purpureum]
MIVDKVVLITGSSSGIGRCLTKAFFEYGFRVYASSRDVLSIKDFEDMGINTLQIDVKDSQSIKDAVNYIIEKEKKIDVLVNNSGVCYYGPAVELPDSELDEMFQTNFFGTVKCTKEVAPHMIKEKLGLIVNVGSVAGYLPMPISSGYCSSKAALHSWSDSLRVELAPFNIKVLTVAPGPIKTDIVNKGLPGLEEIVSNPNSPYAPIFNEIMDRPRTSLKNQVPVQGLVDSIMKRIFSRNSSGVLRYGPGSTVLLLLSYLPSRLLDFIFSKKFGFNKLKSIVNKNNSNSNNNNNKKEN